VRPAPAGARQMAPAGGTVSPPTDVGNASNCPSSGLICGSQRGRGAVIAASTRRCWRRPNASPSDIRQWLVAAAAPLGGGARPDEFGAGLVDARAATAVAEAAGQAK